MEAEEHFFFKEQSKRCIQPKRIVYSMMMKQSSNDFPVGIVKNIKGNLTLDDVITRSIT
jgi:hypothetical protein